MLLVSIAIPNPTVTQQRTFNIILALAAAGVAAMIPGFLNIEVPSGIRAGGAIAVFVVVFFFNPAHAVTNSSDSLAQTATLTGTVEDSDGQGIAGVKVTIDEIPGMIPVESSSDG